MKDPIVLEPPDIDIPALWADCNEHAKHVQRADGSVNWRAAFYADPGVMSCPACHLMMSYWGSRVRCPDCGFDFPTDWWSMYAWGVQAAQSPNLRYNHKERMKHPYYRYGFEHMVDDAWFMHDKIDWKHVLKEVAK